MEGATVREVNSEINVWLGRNHPTRLSALEEGAKVLAREVLREKARIARDRYVDDHNDANGPPDSFRGADESDGDGV